MKHRWWIGGALLVGLVSMALARPGVVRTRDGIRFEGDVTESDTAVTVTVRGIQTRIDRSNVASVDYLPDIEEQFKQRLNKLDAKDVPGRVALARWAFDNAKYIQARDVLEQAMQIDSNNAQAAQLLEIVRRQIRLERGNKSVDAAPVTTIKPVPLLTPAQINILRQQEMGTKDLNLNIRFLNDVQRRFTTATKRDPAAFAKLTPSARATEILHYNDPAMNSDVKILNNPKAMQDYMGSVQRLVLGGCASASCHGGVAAGNFRMINPCAQESATATNFYILNTYSRMTSVKTKKGDEFLEMRMVNRTRFTDSLLLQYALPRELADVPHPKVQGYNGFIRGNDDPRYKTIADWIRSSLTPVMPTYGFDLSLPAATTQPASPATAPATRPAE